MELIDKADVVAEIKRIMDAENESINSFEHHRNTSEKQQYNARMALLERILFLLNTLEVKEVDLVEEIVERCKKSWYNEGKIAGMAEGLTDDEKYQQGWHDAIEKQGEQNHAWNNGYSNGYIKAVEKAVEWLENHNDYIDVKDGNVTYFDMEKCVVDFGKYMKGGEE